MFIKNYRLTIDTNSQINITTKNLNYFPNHGVSVQKSINMKAKENPRMWSECVIRLVNFYSILSHTLNYITFKRFMLLCHLVFKRVYTSNNK